MRVEEIQPLVRLCHTFSVERGAPLEPKHCTDRRLIYVRRGKGAFVAAGEIWEAREGDLFLFPAGTLYEAGGQMQLIGVNFDLFERPGAPQMPVAMIHPTRYREDLRVEAETVSDQPVLNGVIHLLGATFAEERLARMLEEYAGRRLFFRTSLGGEMRALIVQILREAVRGEPEDLAERILRYIRENYRRPMTNETLEAVFHFHESTLSRALRRHTGMPIHRYLLEYRIQQAVNLLELQPYMVEEVARMVGFEDANYFTRYFKKVMGMSPGAYLSVARNPRRSPAGTLNLEMEGPAD